MKDLLKIVNGDFQPTVDIIVVTYNNPRMLEQWAASVMNWTNEPHRVVIVNNGTPIALQGQITDKIKLIQMEKNTGWMGGVNAGMKWCLENSKAPYVLMMNDDTQVLDQDYGWLTKMVAAFDLDPKVAAVGPTSNKIMGNQAATILTMSPYAEATRLSGMAMLVKKSAVREIGMLDESLPGGDDLDYSIRLRKAGYKLCICRRTFLLHHYGQTGRRIHGDYWDSPAHTEAINTALIKKHGFKTWFYCVNDRFDDEASYSHGGIVNIEEDEVRDEIKEELEKGTVLDLGCGGKKIHPKAVGVDFRPNGQLGCGCNELIASAGDVVAEVTDLKPFRDGSVDAIVAKHLLEHIMDIPKALKEWKRVLKPGGKIVVVCPDYRYSEAISCDPSHVHAMTPETCASWFTAMGWNVTEAEHIPRTFVFKLVAEKAEARCSCHPVEQSVGCAP